MTELTIELVPKTCWFSNVRSEATEEQWDRIRKDVYKKANYCCEICGGKGQHSHRVECHEVWEYDDSAHIQKLAGLVALCSACHEVKHFGLAQVRGREHAAALHLAEVNGWNIRRAHTYTDEVFRVWRARSEHNWELDLGYLEETYGIKLKPRRKK
jgi:hypothetical protein